MMYLIDEIEQPVHSVVKALGTKVFTSSGGCSGVIKQ